MSFGSAVSASIRVTGTPACANASAAVQPTGPAPTTITSSHDTGLTMTASEFFEQPAAPDDAVGHAEAAHRMPRRRNVDRNAGLAHHLLDGREEVAGREVGTDLDDGVDIVAVELLEHDADHVAARHVRDRGGAAATQSL